MYIYLYFYIYDAVSRYIYMEYGLSENGNFHLFAENKNGNGKLQSVFCKRKTENGKFVFLGQQTKNGNGCLQTCPSMTIALVTCN